MTVREARQANYSEGLKQRHQARNKALDDAILELWHDFSLHFPRAVVQDTTVGQLLAWSSQQLFEPTDPPQQFYMCAHCRERIEGGLHTCISLMSLEINGNVE